MRRTCVGYGALHPGAKRRGGGGFGRFPKETGESRPFTPPQKKFLRLHLSPGHEIYWADRPILWHECVSWWPRVTVSCAERNLNFCPSYGLFPAKSGVSGVFGRTFVAISRKILARCSSPRFYKSFSPRPRFVASRLRNRLRNRHTPGTFWSKTAVFRGFRHFHGHNSGNTSSIDEIFGTQVHDDDI